MRQIIRANMKRELSKWQKENDISSRSLKSVFKTKFPVKVNDVIFYRFFKPTLHNKVCFAFDAQELFK